MTAQGRLILEIHSSHMGPTITHSQRIDGFPCRIGRAYDNDVILHDPFVSPHHLEIGLHEEEGWVVRDLGSENGFALNDADTTGGEARLHSGDEMEIGKTRIVLFAEEHPVPPTIRLVRDHPWLRFLSGAGVGWLLFIVMAAGFMIATYFMNWTDDTPRRLAETAIGIMTMSLVWASAWALAGRLIRHQAKFSGHLGVFSLVLLLSLGLDYIDGYVAYLTNEGAFSQILSETMFFLLGAFLIYSCLTLSTEMRMRRRMTTAAVFAGGVVLGSFLFSLASSQGTELRPDYPSVIKPYLTDLAPSQDLDAFMKSNAELFESGRFKDFDDAKPAVSPDEAGAADGASEGATGE